MSILKKQLKIKGSFQDYRAQFDCQNWKIWKNQQASWLHGQVSFTMGQNQLFYQDFPWNVNYSNKGIQKCEFCVKW